MAYSSKYYDPVKAHEYYMKHRVLKGRKASTATLNETGRKAADYVKNQISEEQKKSVEAENKSYSDKIFSQTQTAKVKISTLQKKYSKLSSAQKKILGPKLKKELERMKQENEAKRQKIIDQHSKNIKNLDDKYTKTYEKELEKMNADSSMVKQKSSSTSKKTSASSKKSTSKSSTKKTTKKSKTASNDTALKAKYKKIVDDAMARYEQRKKKK